MTGSAKMNFGLWEWRREATRRWLTVGVWEGEEGLQDNSGVGEADGEGVGDTGGEGVGDTGGEGVGDTGGEGVGDTGGESCLCSSWHWLG